MGQGMTFTARQVTGYGRGKLLGFPTINLEIPSSLDLAEGIYAVWVRIGAKKFMGALHYGPVPVFDQVEKSLEVFLLDVKDKDIGDTSVIEVQIATRLREVKAFSSTKDLTTQITLDVARVRVALERAVSEE